MTSKEQPYYVLPWKELLRWDLKSAQAAAFRASHPSFRPMGEFIEEATELVYPAREPSHNWPVFGVNNKGGVNFSHYQLGKSFNSPYKRIKENWFFHNPTRANVGSLGRVPHVPADAITSPEYQVWRIKRGLLPEFVEILIRLPVFLDLVEIHRVGAVKERLFVENLCEIPIPILTDHQQRLLITHWNDTQREIAGALRRIETHIEKMNADFFVDLGLDLPEEVGVPKAFAVRWEALSRWSVSFNFLSQSRLDLTRGKYPVAELGSMLQLVQYGTSEKAVIIYFTTVFL